MASIFSKIVSGEIPSYKVAETNDYLAFLDIMPLRKGHVLVIPKKETDYLFDLPDNEMAGLMNFAKLVAKKMDKVFDCKRIGVTVIGLEVPHAHVHLIPINSVEDMNFSQEKLKLENEELEAIADSIIKA